MKALSFSVLLLTSTAAIAQPAQEPPKFVPFMVDEKVYNDLRNYLRQQPYMFAAPLMSWLERSAEAARQLEAKEKTEPQPK